MAKVRMHVTTIHKCSDDEFVWTGFPELDRFVEGELVDVPDGVADYFKRAGWAADDGEEPIKPDQSQPVFVNPDKMEFNQ